MPEPTPHCINDTNALVELVSTLRDRDRIALDTEANGMHAYTPKLCVVQLAWLEGDEVHGAIIDPFSADPTALAPLLEAESPIKLVHDLTFDVRMLLESNIRLAGVYDTSIAARFLGMTATGLASLVEQFFEVKLGKEFQRHDWSRRPLLPDQLRYLVDDVRYLHALDEELRRRVHVAGIEEEVATECSHRLVVSQVPAQQRPPHERFKGFRQLPQERQRLVFALLQRREELAQKQNVPAHWLAPNRILLDLAKQKPNKLAAVRRICGRHRQAGRQARDWLEAIQLGRTSDLKLPAAAEVEPLSREEIQRRKRAHTVLSRWRKSEAAAREVDLQVVIPGHCMSQVAGALLEGPATAAELAQRLEPIAGLGACRRNRYSQALAGLIGRLDETTTAPSPPDSATDGSATDQPAAIPEPDEAR